VCLYYRRFPENNEVSAESFFKLKEIDSLNKMRLTLIKNKSDQEDRVSKLNERQNESLLQTAKLKQELISITNDLADVEKLLKNASEQKQRVIDVGGDEKKINNFSQDIANYEEKGLEYLSRLEEIESEMADQKSFQSGLAKTIQEIELETKPELEKCDQEIKNIDLRVELLSEELPADFKSLYLRVVAKKLALGPFTRTDQGSCYFCRYKISKVDESEIDSQKSLKTCPQCGRIFLPYDYR
jgi:predicted  nucleic acid-binding Zn-ribbon protein